MPNKNYEKGRRFETEIVNQYLNNGYYALRKWGSKPFDFLIMGNGYQYMCEAKNWAKPPTADKMRKDYKWLDEYAKRHGCEALLFVKQGRGKYNYMIYRFD